MAYDLLGLRSDSQHRSATTRMRACSWRGSRDTPYDLVMGDAFNDYSVPYHLTTHEFNERVRAWLADDGLYMVNLIDGPRHDFLRAYISTLDQTFAHVYVVPAVRSWRESPRVTFVLIATDMPLDLAAFETIDAGDGETLRGRSGPGSGSGRCPACRGPRRGPDRPLRARRSDAGAGGSR